MASQLSDPFFEEIKENNVTSKAHQLRSIALHSINEWKFFLAERTKEKYEELSDGFGALTAAQKKERIIALKDFFARVSLDEQLQKISASALYAKTGNGTSLETLYRLLQAKIQGLPSIIDNLGGTTDATPAKNVKKPEV
jgi:hypothetical protein